MKRGRDRTPATARRPVRATAAWMPTPEWLGRAALLLAVALALWVHRRSLAAYFGLDDLVIIEQVRGLRPLVIGPWRLLSRHLFFGAMVPGFGADPWPYHLAGWLLHGVNVALLYTLVRRRAGETLAAIAAAVLFGASRLHAPALESPARVGEPMALACMLAALLLSDRGGTARLVAAALVALAMLAKESVALLPLVLLVPRPGGPTLAARTRQAAPLLAASAAVAIALVASGATASHLGGEAYQRAYGGNLWLNLMTYGQWAIDLTRALPGQVSAIASSAWPAGIALTLALAALVVAARGRSVLPALGGLWWLLALVPVLPLVHHTYLYYLYVPLAGLALAAAGAIDLAVAWMRGDRAVPTAAGRAVGALALVLLVVYAVAADRLLAERLTLHVPGTRVPLDPDLRKSEMARAAVAGVIGTIGGRPAHIAFLLPAGMSKFYSTATGAEVAVPDSVSYSMLAGALDNGAGLRALVPNADTVAFLPGWKRGYGDFEMFSQNPNGVVFPLGLGADGFATAGAAMRRSGDIRPALEVLAGAVSEFPDHARLRYEYAHALYVAGDTLGTRRELEELLRRSPDDTLAARVRAEFGGRPPR